MNKILFFTSGACPTPEEREQAASIPGRVVFRNAQFAGSEPCEPCEAVAGCVPANYAAAFPAVPVDDVKQEDQDKPKRGRPAKVAQVETEWAPN